MEDAQEITIGGAAYTVDGHNVVLDYSPHEKEIAELLEKEFGGELKMMPRVNNPQGVSTPDYLFRGEGYDLKTVGAKASVNAIYNRVKKAKGQARRFSHEGSERSPLFLCPFWYGRFDSGEGAISVIWKIYGFCAVLRQTAQGRSMRTVTILSISKQFVSVNLVLLFAVLFGEKVG